MPRRPSPAVVLLTFHRAGENHSRGVDVRMCGMPTCGAAKSSALPARLVDMTALCASPRAELGRGLHQAPALTSSLVDELTTQLAPALGQDRTVKSPLLRHARTRLVGGSLRRRSHACYVKSLDRDQAVALGQPAGETMQEVSSYPRLPGAQAGDPIERSLVAARPPALAGGSPPPRRLLTPGLAHKTTQTLSLAVAQPRAGVKRTGGKRCSRGDTAVEPDWRAEVLGRRFGFPCAAQRDMPAKWIARDRQVLDSAQWFARKAKPNPTQLRYSDFTPAPIKPAKVDLALAGSRLDAKAVAAALALEARIARLATKEGREGTIEVPQRLLEDVGVGLGEPGEGAFCVGQLGILSRPPHSLLSHAPRRMPLLEGRIPDRPGATCPGGECIGLVDARVKAVAIAGVLLHEHMFATGPDDRTGGARGSSQERKSRAE